MSERASKQFWAIDGGCVIRVTGYSCAPRHATLWWVPKLGWSGEEDFSLFETKSDAITAGVGHLKAKQRMITKQLATLRKQQ